jgi:hypothetical protein
LSNKLILAAAVSTLARDGGGKDLPVSDCGSVTYVLDQTI